MQVKSTKTIKKILPTPQNIQYIDGYISNFSKYRLYCDPLFHSHVQNLTGIFKDRLPFDTVNTTLPDKEHPGIHIIRHNQAGWYHNLLHKYNLHLEPHMRAQGYILLVLPEQIIITAGSTVGVFNGIQSLMFLLNCTENTKLIPCMAIRDWPSFPVRGLSDDISRGQVSTMDHFKRILRFMARYKMNVYMPYLEDMFRFKSHPLIGKQRGALTAKECLDLQNYADTLHIEIIPIFQTLGHYENLLHQEAYVNHAEYPGSSSLDPVSEETYELLGSMLDEFLPVFRSVWINMGADESWDIGHGASRAKAEQVGVAQVHADHYQRVIEIIRRHDKKIMMYGDIILDHPDILQHLPGDIMIVDWHYDLQTEYSSTRVFRDSGKPYLVSPGTQSWSRIFPDLAHARANISGMVHDGAKNGAEGVITSAWGDFGGGNNRELHYYPWAWGACCAWNTDEINQPNFDRLFMQEFYGSDQPEMALVYRALSNCSDYYDLNHFFGHPFYPAIRDMDHFLKRKSELASTAETVRAMLKKLRPASNRNKEHLDILELCADMYTWVGKLYELRWQLLRCGNHDKPDAEGLLKNCDHLIQSLDNIQTRYSHIWSKHFKPENLHRILGLMQRVAMHLQSKRTEIEQGNYTLNGKLEAPFITCRTDENTPQPDTIAVSRTIHLETEHDQIWLQVIAETHVKIWINDQYYNEVYACRSLSAIVEEKRVRLFAVKELMQTGDNTITLVVRNYKKDAIPAVNIWLECLSPDLLITSADAWQAAPYTGDFNTLPTGHENWPAAVPVDNPWTICRPDLKNGLPSRIEFYRQYPI